MRYVFIMKDGRAHCFEEQGAKEFLMEVFPVNWPVTVLSEEGECTWERVVPELVWNPSEKKYHISWRYHV